MANGLELEGAELKINKAAYKTYAAFSAVWLRRIGNKAQLLVEVNGEWLIACEEIADGLFSHIAEVNGLKNWRADG